MIEIQARLTELQELGLFRRTRLVSGPQGPNVVLAQSDEQVMDLLRGGQGVLSVVLDIEPLQETITQAVQLAFDTDGTTRVAAR